MYRLELTKKFKKDIKNAKKRGLNLLLLDEVVTQLVEKGSLKPKYKPHKLIGNYKGFWECHIQNDWLLIWKQDETIKLISLTRTGSHSDLF
ncbi:MULTISPECIES: type II toxin-antitoxin system YafQ family toxin [unclassified Sphingobacterium]|uniref:type II toxin-antitoxin system YafQ family toxin n=1 Tax=unclassified Sphingobacterium TaxID=2609468 RepID=UPI0020C3D2DF|nr:MULTISPECIES: type II toxin-antitoxin system YafQ family toxin [unclassified Sphingobacterium]MBV2227376.1 type II toxin-antitoxin system YafQ family toxin [Sphingobacterium mizutaii]